MSLNAIKHFLSPRLWVPMFLLAFGQYEQLNYEKFKTKETAKLSIIDYLASYNGKRIHLTLSYQFPAGI
jgi:hypothetical protein